MILSRLIFLIGVCLGAPPWLGKTAVPDKPYENAEVVIGLLRQHFESQAIDVVKKSIRNTGVSVNGNLMKKIMLDDVQCNDGSSSGYYLRKSSGSDTWIIFLDGGWYCFDEKSCQSRWRLTKHMMSSVDWMPVKTGDGILSSDPIINPYWWRSNHIHVPYCSSDCWSGNVKKESKSNNGTNDIDLETISFMGSLIVESVINDLLNNGLNNGHSIILAGTSAGGVGVLLNVDKISLLLRNKGFDIDVRGVVDSAWFLDNEPFVPFQCNDALSCSTVIGLQKGIQTWNGSVPETCLQNMEKSWQCYLAYKIVPLIKAPLFIFQWIFDEAQMLANNVGKPVSKQHWNYIHETGQAVRESLDKTKVVFAPSCIGHGVLSNSYWSQVKVRDVSLADALKCWPSSHYVRPEIKPKKNFSIETNIPLLTSESLIRDDDWYAILPAASQESTKDKQVKNYNKNKKNKRNRSKKRNKKHKAKRNKRKLSKKKHNALKIDEDRFEAESHKNMLSDSPLKTSVNLTLKNKIKSLKAKNNLIKRQERKQKRRQRKKWRRKRKKRNRKRRRFRNKRKVRKDKCNLHLIDPCTWPHCNPTCPPLINPYSGEEMSRVQLLKSFGLNMEDFAQALGVDIPTLKSMNNKDIVHILAP